MTGKKFGAAAIIDGSGRVTVDAGERPEGLLILRFHRATIRGLVFLLRTLRASSGLRVISMLPIGRNDVEVVLDLKTPDRATSFLTQLSFVFAAAEKLMVGTRRYREPTGTRRHGSRA